MKMHIFMICPCEHWKCLFCGDDTIIKQLYGDNNAIEDLHSEKDDNCGFIASTKVEGGRDITIDKLCINCNDQNCMVISVKNVNNVMFFSKCFIL